MPALNGITPWILAGVTLLGGGAGATAYMHTTFATKADLQEIKQDLKFVSETQRRINQKLDYMIWFPNLPPPRPHVEDWGVEEPETFEPQPMKEEEESPSADSNT